MQFTFSAIYQSIHRFKVGHVTPTKLSAKSIIQNATSCELRHFTKTLKARRTFWVITIFGRTRFTMSHHANSTRMNLCERQYLSRFQSISLLTRVGCLIRQHTSRDDQLTVLNIMSTFVNIRWINKLVSSA